MNMHTRKKGAKKSVTGHRHADPSVMIKTFSARFATGQCDRRDVPVFSIEPFVSRRDDVCDSVSIVHYGLMCKLMPNESVSLVLISPVRRGRPFVPETILISIAFDQLNVVEWDREKRSTQDAVEFDRHGRSRHRTRTTSHTVRDLVRTANNPDEKRRRARREKLCWCATNKW